MWQDKENINDLLRNKSKNWASDKLSILSAIKNNIIPSVSKAKQSANKNLIISNKIHLGDTG